MYHISLVAVGDIRLTFMRHKGRYYSRVRYGIRINIIRILFARRVHVFGLSVRRTDGVDSGDFIPVFCSPPKLMLQTPHGVLQGREGEFLLLYWGIGAYGIVPLLKTNNNNDA